MNGETTIVIKCFKKINSCVILFRFDICVYVPCRGMSDMCNCALYKFWVFKYWELYGLKEGKGQILKDDNNILFLSKMIMQNGLWKNYPD